MPYYPNTNGRRGFEWYNQLLSDIPTFPKDNRRVYPRFLKNWRNASTSWYSQNPTSYTPEYEEQQIDDLRNISNVQTNNVLDTIGNDFNQNGMHNSGAQQAMQNKLANTQGANLANTEAQTRNTMERQRYDDWIRWAATAAERKDKMDDLNISRGNLEFQRDLMNRQDSQAGTDWMSLLGAGAKLAGQMTMPYLMPGPASAAGAGAGAPGALSGAVSGLTGGGGEGGIVGMGQAAFPMMSQGLSSVGSGLSSLGSSAASGLGSLGSAAASGLGSLGSAAGSGLISSLGWLAALL